MTNLVTIAGQTVDADDPCALVPVLESIRLKMISGERVTEIFVQDFNSTRRTRYSDLMHDKESLEREIERQRGLCEKKQGKAPRRFAIAARQRHY